MTYLVLNNQLRAETDAEVVANLRRKGWQDAPAKPSDDAIWQNGAWVVPPAPSYTAEEWITSQGYSATRLVSLLDVEAKLNAAAKVSGKASAVRGWLDTVLTTFAADPTPRNDWPVAPHAYEETIQEALTILTT